MKENKEKGVVNEETLPEMESQPRPSVRDKRKNLSKTVELENLPSHLKDKRGHPKPGSSSLALLFLLPFNSHPSKFMM